MMSILGDGGYVWAMRLGFARVFTKFVCKAHWVMGERWGRSICRRVIVVKKK